jgi:C4-type Zn-finger protein
MKTAKYVTTQVEIECPICHETIPEKATGSLFWAVYEAPIQGETITCPSCKGESKMPRVCHS